MNEKYAYIGFLAVQLSIAGCVYLLILWVKSKQGDKLETSKAT